MKYLVETKKYDFTIDVPEGARIEINDYEGQRNMKVVVPCTDEKDGYGPVSVLAFYTDIEAIRAENVTREQEEVA